MHEYSDIFHLGCSLLFTYPSLLANASSGFHMFFYDCWHWFSLVMEHLGLNTSFTSGLLCLTHLIACSLWSISLPSSIQKHSLENHSMQTVGGTWEFSIPCGSALSLWLTCMWKPRCPDFPQGIHLLSSISWRIGTNLRLYLKLHPNVHSFLPVLFPYFLNSFYWKQFLNQSLTCKCHARVCLSELQPNTIGAYQRWSIGWEPSFLIFFSAFLWFMPCGMWDLISRNEDRTCVLCSGTSES